VATKDEHQLDAGTRPDLAKPAFAETEFLARTEQVPAARPAGSVTNPQAWVGAALGKYQVSAVLGQGGMGVVLRAHDPMIERDVAVKVLAAELAADATMLQRFLAEAKAAGKLHHPNIVSIFEIGNAGTTYYLIMELVSGGTVAEQLDSRGACSVLEATRIVIDACKGLAAAHAAGLVHRDIKPANLMRAADGSVKIADFGLAKGTSPRAHELTQTGVVVGTPYFMSPEQCEAKPVDARSDIYSLGATYFTLLTGTNPYEEASSVMQVMFGHCHGPIPDPRALNSSLPPACAAIVSRAMAKAPGDRYQSAGDMLADLQAVAATLSGQTPIDLPSASGARPAATTATMGAPTTGIAPTTPSTGTMGPMAGAKASRGLHGWRRWGIIAGGLAAGLLLGVLLWRPWQQPAAIPVLTDAPPIQIGVLHSLSGTMAASETVVVEATLLALEEINDAGGLLGRKVKPVIANGRSDPDVFAREAKKLITQDQVATVFGCWTSASRKTVLPIFEEHDHLLIYPVQYEGLETSPNIMYLGAAPNQQIIPAVDWAMKSLQRKRFFIVGSDYVFPRAAGAIIRDELKKAGMSASVVGEEYVPLGSQNVEPLIQAIRTAKPDMILNTINGDTNVAFFRQLRAAGIVAADVPCLSFSIGEQGLRGLDAPDVAGHYAAWTYFQALEGPANAAFLKRFLEKYPERAVTDPAEAAYVGVKLWAQAVRSAASAEPKKIRRAMLNQRLTAPDGEVRIDADTQHCFKTPRVGQITGEGQFHIVWSASAPVAPEPYPATRTAADWKAFLHDLYAGWGNQWSAPAKSGSWKSTSSTTAPTSRWGSSTSSAASPFSPSATPTATRRCWSGPRPAKECVSRASSITPTPSANTLTIAKAISAGSPRRWTKVKAAGGALPT
jgi:urea transport system substrate-binding protein